MTSAPPPSASTTFDGTRSAATSPIVRDYAFTSEASLPEAKSAIGARFLVRDSLFVASPTGYDHGAPGPLSMTESILPEVVEETEPEVSAPSYETAIQDPDKPKCDGKKPLEIVQLARMYERQYEQKDTSADMTSAKTYKTRKIAVCACTYLILMVMNGSLVLAMLFATERIGLQEGQTPSGKQQVTAAALSGLLSAIPSGMILGLVWCAFRMERQSARGA